MNTSKADDRIALSAGLGWGALAKQMGLNWGKLVSDARHGGQGGGGKK